MIRAARRFGVCFLAFASVLALPATAQLSGPAETPPETFRGDQYVDSGGCVFIRTGIDGNTRWLPRVDRERAPVCGARPSAATAPVRAAAPVIRRDPAPAAPRQIEGAVPAPGSASTRAAIASAPIAPQPAATRRAAPKVAAASGPSGCGTSSLSARYIPGCAAPAPAPVTTVTSASTPAEDGAVPLFAIARPIRGNEQVVTRAPSLDGAVRIDARTPSPNRSVGIGGVATRAMRGCVDDCSAPPTRIATPIPATVAARPGAVIVPAARTTFDVSTPPRGYRKVFTDGRLNPNRGPQTLQGDYQSEAIWTNESPRRLRGVIYTTR